jgi:hypothetical protein
LSALQEDEEEDAMLAALAARGWRRSKKKKKQQYCWRHFKKKKKQQHCWRRLLRGVGEEPRSSIHGRYHDRIIHRPHHPGDPSAWASRNCCRKE